MNKQNLRVAMATAMLIGAGCGKPGMDSLRDSFAQQLASNHFVKEFQRSGDDLTFSGPAVDGAATKWRVHIDSATVEQNTDPGSKPRAQPYKGIVKSSWHANGRQIRPAGRESNLPLELTSNGLGQE